MMKRRFATPFMLGTAALGAVVFQAYAASSNDTATAPATVAAIGKPAPNFTLTTPHGKTISLNKERQGQKATVLMFVSVQCPVSNDYNARMVQVAKDYASKGVRFIGINSNSTETVADIAKHARESQFPFPVLIDVGNTVADQYEAKVTPHVYLIDGNGVLRYRGRIDDQQNAANVKTQDLRTNLDAVLAGRPIATGETRAFGCSIKRMEKESGS